MQKYENELTPPLNKCEPATYNVFDYNADAMVTVTTLYKYVKTSICISEINAIGDVAYFKFVISMMDENRNYVIPLGCSFGKGKSGVGLFVRDRTTYINRREIALGKLATFYIYADKHNLLLTGKRVNIGKYHG